MSDFRIEDHTQEVLAAMDKKIKKALTMCGEKAQGYAMEKAPVDEGTLRNSIQYKVVDKDCYIGTNLSYAPYVEFGTGKYYPGGRQTPWVYKDKKGNWHMTNGNRAQPYLKPAAANHAAEYKKIIKDTMKE